MAFINANNLTQRQRDSLDAYQQFQVEKHGNILVEDNYICTTAPEDVYEEGIEELNRLSEWVDQMAEMQLEDRRS